MGCTGSTNSRYRSCENAPTTIRRSQSLRARTVPEDEIDSSHAVTLTSTTPEAFNLYDGVSDRNVRISRTVTVEDSIGNDSESKTITADFVDGDSKRFSSAVVSRITIVRTPVMTPRGEPEIIDVWELMEGLEDTSPLMKPPHIRSFSTGTDGLRSSENVVTQTSNWKNSSDFLVESTLSNTSFLNHLDAVKCMESDANRMEINDDDEHNVKMEDRDFVSCEIKNKKVIMYFTSLRAVRKTYEDCCEVRTILKGVGVWVDERDVSMHSAFKVELDDLVGCAYRLPQVFIGEQHVGGADEVRRTHDEGLLGKMLEGCKPDAGPCEGCADLRFVLCESCRGSCKIYFDYAEDEQSDDGGGERESGEFGFRRCPKCNENGIIHCPICCD